jgi:hypothetical protein
LFTVKGITAEKAGTLDSRENCSKPVVLTKMTTINTFVVSVGQLQLTHQYNGVAFKFND